MKANPLDQFTFLGTVVRYLQGVKEGARIRGRGYIDNIRDNFRNPTDHPEMIYGIDEAQDLFGLVADVLNRMAKEFP